MRDHAVLQEKEITKSEYKPLQFARSSHFQAVDFTSYNISVLRKIIQF